MHIDSNLTHVLLSEQENLSRHSPALPANVLVTPPPSAEDLEQIEQRVARAEPRDIVEFNGIEINLDDYIDDTPEKPDVRTISPREMVDISLDLYIDGQLSYDEYSMLAFQPELHPQYDSTIGSLTGDRPEPDRPRDFIHEWEDRLSFEQRYPSDTGRTTKQIEHILAALKSMDSPIDFLA